LKCLEARLLEFEKGKQEAMELNEQLVKKLKACEMLRSRGEQFIDGLYKALDQGKPVKLMNSKGHTVSFKKKFFKIIHYGTQLASRGLDNEMIAPPTKIKEKKINFILIY